LAESVEWKVNNKWGGRRKGGGVKGGGRHGRGGGEARLVGRRNCGRGRGWVGVGKGG